MLADPAIELRLLRDLERYGFALLHQVPVEKGQVAAVGDRLGHVRVTNYGRLFDVVSLPNPNNLAFTAVGLGVHTDNPYRDPTPGLQLLHCLESDAPGGETMLVDGFRAAEELRRRHPEDFAVLARLPLSFHFADANADLKATTPCHRDGFRRPCRLGPFQQPLHERAGCAGGGDPAVVSRLSPLRRHPARARWASCGCASRPAIC